MKSSLTNPVTDTPAALQAPLRPATAPPQTGQNLTPWLLVVVVVVLFSGGLFGYDQGVISGALHGIKSTFSLSPLVVEVVTSWVTLGALIGALAAGELADGIGRKRTVLIAGAMFTVGSLVQALAPDTIVLVAGRLVIGAGVGVAAVAAPLYAAELAPTNLRGRFVSAYQLAITIGIFLAYLVDGWLSRSDSWRIMLGASAVPGLLLLGVALLAPASPRWLMMKGRRKEAAAELTKIRPGVDFKPRLDAIENALRQEGDRASWGEVFRREWRRPLLIGVGLAVFQQITGINAIIYYADQIFASAGFITQSSQTTVTTWAIGGVNVVATLIAIAYIDRLGRRKLLLTGLVGMAISLIVVGIAFRFIGDAAVGATAADAGTGPSTTGIVTLVALVGFIICFAFSMGPVVWTVINEIFPGHIRGRAVAVATAVNWGSAFLVSQFFLTVIGAIGNSLTFWLFAVFCVIAWVWIYFRVPETKGQSLEQIQLLWKGTP
jgi:SP family galactose:H+ symporter-like MFS transporter